MAYNFYSPYQPQMNYNPYQAQQNTVQNGGFVRVPNEAAARNYPIAPGNSITFIDENAPYCYTMTMGFSQFDRPKFEKFRLVKEEDAPAIAQNNAQTNTNPAEIEQIKAEIEQIKAEIEVMKGKKVIDDVKPIDKQPEQPN